MLLYTILNKNFEVKEVSKYEEISFFEKNLYEKRVFEILSHLCDLTHCGHGEVDRY
jgi:hypothetical protein